MKLLKSKKELDVKRKGGRTKITEPMAPGEEIGSYEEYDYPLIPTGKDGDELIINDKTYYHWVFYQESSPHSDPGKNKRMYKDDLEQERYEWFCAGWVDFYDKIVLPAGDIKDVEHKLFFFWDRKDMDGVAIYINDEKAVKNKEKDIQLSYTPATATGDPPLIPPPPPPSAK